MLLSTLLSITALTGFFIASPADAMKLIVKNQCKYDITVSKIDNGQTQGTNDGIAQANSRTYILSKNWHGRLFGRNGCSRKDCTSASASKPATMAEFIFRGDGGQDIYDISVVDGYNLPMKIEPIGGKSDSNNPYQCGSPICSPLPSCPGDMRVYYHGNYSGCQSGCSKFDNQEYCCTGAFNTPNTCPPNQYSQVVKKQCPTARTYAFDDSTSTFNCNAKGYNVIFCP